ncbi:EAL domain-containing protein [Bacillus sp. 2205SS5-2]|uniref:EAL domain-containing protein n=1 Tax=Bacillus sp. 2205SS5-2 TaxID=3109031 RepID=UPI0030068011
MLKLLFSKNKSDCSKMMERVSFLLKHEEIETYAQSIVSLQNKEVLAFELLNRPNSSTEFHSPDQFYSFAASHGQIHKVDTHVLKLALRRASSHSPLKQPHFLFVNIHLSTLFSKEWEDCLPAIKKSSSRVVLELSEREGLEGYTKQQVMNRMKTLRSYGMKIAVNDIGKGYSGLHTLSMVQPDFVKIDRELVKDIESDPYRQYMMTALVQYWSSQNVDIIAEGIEREEEATFFRNLGVQYGQGYLYHKPERITKEMATV